MSGHRVAVVVPTNFTLFELGVAVEVFGVRRPEIDVEWYDLRICTAQPGTALAHDGVLATQIMHGMEAVETADTVIIPQAASLAEPAEAPVLSAIRRAFVRGARLASFCDGAFVLAAAGLLDGRPATTHWKFARWLAYDYPSVEVRPKVLYIDDGQILTSAGTAAGVDLSLHMVRNDHGAHVARQVARSMVVPPHRDGGQAQFIMTPVPPLDEVHGGIQRAMDHMAKQLDEDYSLADMASVALMSTRNFSRRFREVTGTTPGRWLLNQRLTRARELLEKTDLPIARVAELAGFSSPVTLRQRFAQVFCTSPTSYRRTFRAPSRDGRQSGERGVIEPGREGERQHVA